MGIFCDFTIHSRALIDAFANGAFVQVSFGASTFRAGFVRFGQDQSQVYKSACQSHLVDKISLSTNSVKIQRVSRGVLDLIFFRLVQFFIGGVHLLNSATFASAPGGGLSSSSPNFLPLVVSSFITENDLLKIHYELYKQKYLKRNINFKKKKYITNYTVEDPFWGPFLQGPFLYGFCSSEKATDFRRKK